MVDDSVEERGGGAVLGRYVDEDLKQEANGLRLADRPHQWL